MKAIDVTIVVHDDDVENALAILNQVPENCESPALTFTDSRDATDEEVVEYNEFYADR